MSGDTLHLHVPQQRARQPVMFSSRVPEQAIYLEWGFGVNLPRMFYWARCTVSFQSSKSMARLEIFKRRFLSDSLRLKVLWLSLCGSTNACLIDSIPPSRGSTTDLQGARVYARSSKNEKSGGARQKCLATRLGVFQSRLLRRQVHKRRSGSFTPHGAPTWQCSPSKWGD